MKFTHYVFFIFSAISMNLAQASIPSIEIQTELLVNGKAVASPRVLASVGEPATVRTQTGSQLSKLKILAKPTSYDPDEIMVDLDLDFDTPTRRIQTNPQIVAKAGTEALITLEESTNDEKIQIRVLAQPRGGAKKP